MKKKVLLRLITLLFLAGVACSACSSGVNMHKHNRSDCNCPTF